MNVLAVKRGDKCLIQGGDNSVGHFVATMLDGLQLRQTIGHVGGVFQDVLQETGTFRHILRHFGEHAEEFGLSRNQTDHDTWGSSMTCLAGRIVRPATEAHNYLTGVVQRQTSIAICS